MKEKSSTRLILISGLLASGKPTLPRHLAARAQPSAELSRSWIARAMIDEAARRCTQRRRHPKKACSDSPPGYRIVVSSYPGATA
jgi:hypothetical protein